MEIRSSETTVKVPSFRTILFERLATYGISEEIATTVLEEITITTAIFIHKQRKAERAALQQAKVMGRVIHLEPGAAMKPASEASSPTVSRRDLPPAVEL